MRYFVFRDDLDAQPGAEGLLGHSDSWDEAFQKAGKFGTATICVLSEEKGLDTIARVSDGYKWYFYENSPVSPGRYPPETSVYYREDSKTKVGMTDNPLVVWEPGAASHQEVLYGIDGQWVDETQIIGVIPSPQQA